MDRVEISSSVQMHSKPFFRPKTRSDLSLIISSVLRPIPIALTKPETRKNSKPPRKNGQELCAQPSRVLNCCLHSGPLSLHRRYRGILPALLPAWANPPLFKHQDAPAFAGVTLCTTALDKDVPSTCWRVAGATYQPKRTPLTYPQLWWQNAVTRSGYLEGGMGWGRRTVEYLVVMHVGEFGKFGVTFCDMVIWVMRVELCSGPWFVRCHT